MPRNRAIIGYGSQAEVGTGSSGSASGRRRRGRGGEEDEDGGEEGGNSNLGMSASDLDVLVGTALRYVLMNQHNTIQRIEISKYLAEDHTVSKAAFVAIMKEVKKRLEEYFGYQVVDVSNNAFMLYNPFTLSELKMELEEEEEDASGVFASFQPSSITNGRAYDDEDEDEDDEEERPPEDLLDLQKKGLLLIVISNLYMSDEPMTENELMECLEWAGIDPETKFGAETPAEKLTAQKICLEEFRVHNYIKRTKVKSDEPEVPPYFTVEWGPRAWIEFSPAKVVDFVKSIAVSSNDGPEEAMLWERVAKKVAKDEEARNALLTSGLEAFEEIMGKNRRSRLINIDGSGRATARRPTRNPLSPLSPTSSRREKH